jgi:hypothetical protein
MRGGTGTGGVFQNQWGLEKEKSKLETEEERCRK